MKSQGKVDTTKIFEEFVALLETLTEDEWHLEVDENWTVKDVISHLIGWNDEARKELIQALRDGTEPWFIEVNDYSDFNERNVLKYRNLSGGKVLNEFIRSNRDYEQLIENIGEEILRSKFKSEDWVFDECEDNHYLKHFKQIKRAVEARRMNH